MATALVFVMVLAVAAAMGVLTWGLFLEARSNREWPEQGLPVSEYGFPYGRRGR